MSEVHRTRQRIPGKKLKDSYHSVPVYFFEPEVTLVDKAIDITASANRSAFCREAIMKEVTRVLKSKQAKSGLKAEK